MASLPILRTKAINFKVVGELQGPSLPVKYRALAEVDDAALRKDIGQGFGGLEKIYARFPVRTTAKGNVVWRTKKLEFNRTQGGIDLHNVSLISSSDPAVQAKTNELIRQYGVAGRVGPEKNTTISRGAWLQNKNENIKPFTPASRTVR